MTSGEPSLHAAARVLARSERLPGLRGGLAGKRAEGLPEGSNGDPGADDVGLMGGGVFQ